MKTINFNVLRRKAEFLLTGKLRCSGQPISITEITKFFEESKIPYPKRIAKEVAWKMLEDGTAKFNQKGSLELVPENNV